MKLLSNATRCARCDTYKDSSEFNKNRTRKNGHNSECRVCSRLRHKSLNERHPQRRRAAHQRSVMRLITYVEGRGGQCEICGGSWNDLRLFDLHHVDPSRKTTKLTSSKWTGGPRGQAVAREADSCALLCPVCHRRVHFALSEQGKSLFPKGYTTPDGTIPIIP